MKKIEKQQWSEVDKKGMQLTGFVMVQNALKIKIARDTSPQAAFLYITILSHKNATTHQAHPSIDLLAREMGVSKRTVSVLIKDLYDAGYIQINSGKQKIANNYYFPYEEDYDEQQYDATGHVYKRKTKFRKQPKEKQYDIPVINIDDVD